jgi:hypothetical protein
MSTPRAERPTSSCRSLPPSAPVDDSVIPLPPPPPSLLLSSVLGSVEAQILSAL